MSEIAVSKRRLSGIFKKKKDHTEQKGKNSGMERKREHTTMPLSAGQLRKEVDRISAKKKEQVTESHHNTLSEEPSDDKEKPKNLRRRLPFGKVKRKKAETSNLTDDESEVLVEYSGEVQGLNEYEGENKDQEQVLEVTSGIQQHSGECEDKDVFRDVCEVPLDTEVQPLGDLRSLDAPEISKTSHDRRANFFSHDEVPSIVVEPEVQPGKAGFYLIPWSPIFSKIFLPLKELVLNGDKRQAYNICFTTADIGMAKLLGFCSFLANQASETSRQVLLYFITSLIKKYPHCFKVQIKQTKCYRKKTAPKKLQKSNEMKENYGKTRAL